MVHDQQTAARQPPSPRSNAAATAMASEQTTTPAAEDQVRHLPHVQVKTSSPCFPPPPATPTSASSATTPSHRRIGIAVDLSNESAFAVKWAVENYIRPGDAVILIHVRSTSFLYGADWGSSTPTPTTTGNNPFSKQSAQQTEEDSDSFTATKPSKLRQPLVDAGVPFKIHIVKDHDMKERLCLEVERLNLSAVIMGSRGIGALNSSGGRGLLGSVSDYCVQHCACPVVVVRYNQAGKAAAAEEHPVFHDANDHI